MKWLERRREFTRHHEEALKAAQETYDKYKHLDTVSKEYDDGPFHVYTAASPYREAWDTYFAVLHDLGEDPWKGKKRFDKELVQ